jgi:hypothetical protein
MGKILKIRALLDVEEDVFRDLEIGDENTFEDLHYAIIDAFEWEAQSMASFYESNDDWDRGREIPLMDMQEEFGPRKMQTMPEIQLKELITESGQKFLYVFDFLLMWVFYVDIVAIKDLKKMWNTPF